MAVEAVEARARTMVDLHNHPHRTAEHRRTLLLLLQIRGRSLPATPRVEVCLRCITLANSPFLSRIIMTVLAGIEG